MSRFSSLYDDCQHEICMPSIMLAVLDVGAEVGMRVATFASIGAADRSSRQIALEGQPGGSYAGDERGGRAASV